MSSGTKLIQNALSFIGAHSIVMPANPEAISTGKDMLNSMIARWEDDNIEIGLTPLKNPADELNEPSSCTNGIQFNLAIELAPLFPNATVSSELVKNANRTLNEIKRKWRISTIPKPKARGTLPKGQGNNGYAFTTAFMDKGSDIG